MTSEEKLERRKWEVRLEFAYRKAKKKLQSFPAGDREKVGQLIKELLEKRQKNPKLKENNIWDAHARAHEGIATKQDKELLKKYSAEIKNLDKLLHAWNHYAQLNTLFLLQEKGTDLLETASVLGEIFDEKIDKKEADKKLKNLMRKRKDDELGTRTLRI